MDIKEPTEECPPGKDHPGNEPEPIPGPTQMVLPVQL